MFDWVVGFVRDAGYLGVALLMFLENVFPPIPSELIIPFAGFAVQRGELNLFGVLAATTGGAVIGMSVAGTSTTGDRAGSGNSSLTSAHPWSPMRATSTGTTRRRDIEHNPHKTEHCAKTSLDQSVLIRGWLRNALSEG